jgi:FixJ family two-component response regulator
MKAEPVVYLVDDDPAEKQALRGLLQAQAMTVHAFASADEFLRAHDPLAPGCAVVDICLPGLGGLGLQQALLDSDSERLIVFMTGRGDVAATVQAMKAGAVDFLLKPFHEAVFLAAVRDALARDEHARRLHVALGSIRRCLATLTSRELQVLRHVVDGRLNKQIAADLGIAEKTVKVHRARAMEKMGAGSLAALVRKAVAVEVGALVEDRLGGPGASPDPHWTVELARLAALDSTGMPGW